MANLLSKNNTQQERQILYSANLHWISFFLPTIFTLIGSLGVFGLFITHGLVRLIAFLIAMLFVKGVFQLWDNISIKIFVTDGYLSVSKGILGKTITDIKLNRMEGMQLHQNFIGRMLDYGTLIVTTGEVSQYYIIDKPSKLRESIINQNY